MADNVTFQTTVTATPPNATTVATDDVGGVQYQRVKLDVGGDGVSVPVVGTVPLGTVQVLGSVQTVGTSQVLGSVQTVGTSQVLGTTQPLAGSVHLAAGSVNAQGVIAHAAAIAGNPLLMGAFGSSGTQAAVADGQFTRLWADLNGRLVTRGTIDSIGTVQVLGSIQLVGTNQALGSVQTVGTSQVLGSVQTVGTSQVLGSVQTVGTAQVLGSVQTVGTSQVLGTIRTAAAPTTTTRTRTGIAANSITQLMGQNANRIGFVAYTETQAFFIQYGTTCGTFDYTVVLQPNSYYEDPYRYPGSISAFSTVAGGSIMITEF